MLGRDKHVLDRGDDRLRQLVLDGEVVDETTVIPFGPQLAPAFGLDKSRRHPQPFAGATQASGQHIVGAGPRPNWRSSTARSLVWPPGSNDAR